MAGDTEMTGRLFMVGLETMLQAVGEQHHLNLKEQENQAEQEAVATFHHGMKRQAPLGGPHGSAIVPHNV